MKLVGYNRSVCEIEDMFMFNIHSKKARKANAYKTHIFVLKTIKKTISTI